MYPIGHRVFVGCSRNKTRSLADKALVDTVREPNLQCGCEPALPKVKDASVCNSALCLFGGCWIPTSFESELNYTGLSLLLCNNSSSGWVARATGATRQIEESRVSFSASSRHFMHLTRQHAYTCCPASNTDISNISPPGIAGQKRRNGSAVEGSFQYEDSVCPSAYRYRCANIFTPKPDSNLLRPGRRLFWRVDTIMTRTGRDMHLVPGAIWSFRTAWIPQPPQSDAPRSFSHPLGKPDDHCPAPPVGASHTWTGPMCTTRYEATTTNVSLPGCSSDEYKDISTANITIDSRYFHPVYHYTLRGVRVCLKTLYFSAGINKIAVKFAFPGGNIGYDPRRSKTLWLSSENGKVSSAIKRLTNVCFQDNDGFLTKLSSSAALTHARVSGAEIEGRFAAREESLHAVVGDLGRNPRGGNLVLSVKVTGSDLVNAIGHIGGWYVELDFQGGGSSYTDWEKRERDRSEWILRDSMMPWCSPPTPPPPPVCPEHMELKDGETYCPASKEPGSHLAGSLCTSKTWMDTMSDDCESYSENPHWCAIADFFTNADGESARQACCACGGGRSNLLGRSCPLVVTLSGGGSKTASDVAPRMILPKNLQLQPWQCFTLKRMGRSPFSWPKRENLTGSNITIVSDGLHVAFTSSDGCSAHDRWERGEARGGGSETRHFIEKRTYTKVLLVHPTVPDNGQRQGPTGPRSLSRGLRNPL